MSAESLRNVQERVAEIAKTHQRNAPDILAVSKTKSIADIEALYAAGQRHFGENYVQEIIQKSQSLPEDIQWHMIGHLQSNKCKTLVEIPNLYSVESVDNKKIADKLNSAALSLNKKVRVMIEVNTSAETSKFGSSVEDVPVLADHIVTVCGCLSLIGLMTIAHPDRSIASMNFRTLSELRVCYSIYICIYIYIYMC
eukprot:GHVR01130175.1.p1 GENE.GHVR01130175.1~~GHVR01130175.1.p1  ORF type:complete len:197 (+),score=16.53 GHVR01130175.1:84-674(+)